MSASPKDDQPNKEGGTPTQGASGDLDARLARLRNRLDEQGGGRKLSPQEAKREQDAKSRQGMAQAFRLSSEFIAGVVVGAGIGYAIDKIFGTTPWGLIIFLMLGFAAAVVNVLRSAGMMAESELRLKSSQELHKGQQDEESEQQGEK